VYESDPNSRALGYIAYKRACDLRRYCF